MTTNTTAAVLRRIRKLLPNGFTKIKVSQHSYDENDIWPGYTNGSLRIQVKGICEWRAKTTEKEACVATQIVISAIGATSRYYRPRKDSTFNYDGLGTRLQLMVVQDAARTKEMAAHNKQMAAQKKQAERDQSDLRKLGKQRGWDENILHEYRGGKHGESMVSINTRGDGISISVHGLSLNQIDDIMEHVA